MDHWFVGEFYHQKIEVQKENSMTFATVDDSEKKDDKPLEVC